MVTVLMPVYNGEKYLVESIESVLNQTYKNFELLIIDDFSNDQSVKIIKSFNDERIQVIQNPKNLSQSYTMNIGLRLARGIYIARLDQDDLCQKERLKKQLEFLLKYDYSIVGSWASIINKNSEITGYYHFPTQNNDIVNAMGIGNALAHSSVMMRKKDIQTIGGYSEEFKIAMDWDLWIRAIRHGFKIGNIAEYLISHRIHNEQTSYNMFGIREHQKEANIIMHHSVSLITSKSNYNAYLGWRYYYKILLFQQSLNRFSSITQLIMNILNFRGLFEFIKLVIYHKIINNPTNLYIPSITHHIKKYGNINHA
tara:strand:- start:27 stop:962 length:936 start_codon:yes stop_codon:yes gene_type:complete